MVIPKKWPFWSWLDRITNLLQRVFVLNNLWPYQISLFLKNSSGPWRSFLQGHLQIFKIRSFAHFERFIRMWCSQQWLICTLLVLKLRKCIFKIPTFIVQKCMNKMTTSLIYTTSHPNPFSICGLTEEQGWAGEPRSSKNRCIKRQWMETYNLGTTVYWGRFRGSNIPIFWYHRFLNQIFLTICYDCLPSSDFNPHPKQIPG